MIVNFIRKSSHQTGDDRPISNELRGRIDSLRQSHGAKSIRDQVKNFSSYSEEFAPPENDHVK